MQDLWMFFILLFLSVFFISQALILPAAGRKAKHSELVKRLEESRSKLDSKSRSLLNEQYLKGLTPFERTLVKFPLIARLQKSVELAGINSSFGNLFIVTLIISIAFGLFLLLVGAQWYLIIAAMASVWVVLHFHLQQKIIKRLNKFEEQLPEALDIIRRMLQAGKPLNQTFHEVGIEMDAPISEEFENTFNLLNYGYDLRLAILQMADRVPTVSMLAFSSAVMLQKETGGNLSENLEKVSIVLRSRFKLARKIRTLSAESRLSAWILVLAPFGLFLGLTFLNPEYLDPLYDDPAGIKMVSIGVVSLFLGSIWIKKIINFEV
ncbi:type II secretion system F family protein [Vibrio sp. CK2-1]|uniref:type II secretion system F family protein n=1 Tax=Vibrio sp. CK2-1 TaxID=2912249 RepID=UPI001F30543C|nr:type II secretion system F family protein [Vibrio sp. CK2-1]MCF7354029.1 type II secretion system F family protein [Vibrio sp. CK2-1]